MNNVFCLYIFFLKLFQILRNDKIDDKTGTVSSVQVQVRNIKLGITTFWSLEKFECKLAAMKELYEVSNNWRTITKNQQYFVKDKILIIIREENLGIFFFMSS